MVLVFASIPLMVLAIAIATVPIMIAMRKEAAEQRRAVAAAGLATQVDHSEAELRRAA